jgi:arylsulfatase A-like enzyme
MVMSTQRRPNFLVIVTDEMPGNCLGCDGHPLIQTPNLDRLAADGVRFSRSYTVHPMCMTTRASWFTGRTPRGHGVRCNGMPLDPALPTVPETLRQAGYFTHGIGKHHLRNWSPERDTDPATLDPQEWCEVRGFWAEGRISSIPAPYYGLESVDFLCGNGNGIHGDYVAWADARDPEWRQKMAPPPPEPDEYTLRRVWPSRLPAELHYNQWMTERCVAAMDHAQQSDQPFFIWHSFPDPHPPYTAPEPWGSMYDPADVPPPNRREGELDDLPDHMAMQFRERFLTSGCIGVTDIPDDHIRRMRAMTYGMISHVDHHVGLLLDELDRRGLREDTVVVFMADHGRCLGDHWLDNMPPAHFDEVLRVPGIWRHPRRFASGLATDALVSALDFAPTILDLAGLPIPEGDAPPTPECGQQRPPWPGHCLTPLLTGETDRVRDAVLCELDEDYLGLQLRTLITDNAWLTVYGGNRSQGELFDLEQDPNQLHNLWSDPAAASLKADMQARMLYEVIETDSALPRRLTHA